MSTGLAQKSIPLNRMDCPTCIPLLEKEVGKLEGVDEVKGNFMTKTLKVKYDASRVQLSEIEAAIERLGYQIAYKRYPSPLSRLKGLFKKEEPKTPTLSDADFPGKVLHASKTVVVLFSSPTCPTCRIFEPEFLKIAEKVKERADLYKMDISTTEAWHDYEILSIPSVIIFKAGEVSKRFSAMPKTEDIREALGA